MPWKRSWLVVDRPPWTVSTVSPLSVASADITIIARTSVFPRSGWRRPTPHRTILDEDEVRALRYRFTRGRRSILLDVRRTARRHGDADAATDGHPADVGHGDRGLRALVLLQPARPDLLDHRLQRVQALERHRPRPGPRARRHHPVVAVHR